MLVSYEAMRSSSEVETVVSCTIGKNRLERDPQRPLHYSDQKYAVIEGFFVSTLIPDETSSGKDFFYLVFDAFK